MRSWLRRSHEPSLQDCSYAVVDCETTGLFPGAHHRVIELAVIQLDSVERQEREWSTLINPGRDLGDADIHGIRGRDVRDAPRFEEVAGSVLALLAGRVIVAHNARFDCSFLEAELARTGYQVTPLAALCTIEMARRLGLDAGGVRLADCCRRHRIPVEHQHQALSDARLCASLLEEYARRANETGLTQLSACGCVGFDPDRRWPVADDRASALPRAVAPATKSEPSFLARIVSSRTGVAGATSESTAYYELLDRALEDRRLTESESTDLLAAAELYGLSGDHLARVHSQYMDSVCAAALADGRVTDREMYDLELVAELLGIQDLEDRLTSAARGGGQLGGNTAPVAAPSRDRGGSLAGQTVCFTGKLLCSYAGEPLTRERATELAEEAGMVVQPRVTKDLKVLVVADPETNSGKARKAREYGIRVIAETQFWQMIGVTVE